MISINKKAIALSVVMFATMPTAYADKSVYFGASALNADYSDNSGSAEDSATGFSVSMGKYVAERASIEVAYADYGNVESSNNSLSGEFELQALQISAVGYLPLSNRAGIFGRVGAERVKLKGTVTNGVSTQKGSETDNSMFYGVGGYYNVSDTVDLRLEYQRHDLHNVDVDTVSAGFTVETY